MIFRTLFCKHKNTEFLGNIFGDLILCCSDMKHINRSVWLCKNCGRLIFSQYFGNKDHETFNEWLRRATEED